MKFGDIIGQAFRDASGMPPKVATYNSRLKVYDGISSDVSEVEKLVIKYFEESMNIDWKMFEARRLKIESDMARGVISTGDYVSELQMINDDRDAYIDAFVSSSSSYFVTAYKNKLYSVKDRHKRDPYIGVMSFDTWFQMKCAKELAELAALQIRCSDRYVDAKRIAEIYENYKMKRHMRKGR